MPRSSRAASGTLLVLWKPKKSYFMSDCDIKKIEYMDSFQKFCDCVEDRLRNYFCRPHPTQRAGIIGLDWVCVPIQTARE